MNKLILCLAFALFSTSAFSDHHDLDQCKSALAKLKPKCNFVGSGFKGLKEFSSKNKTIGQSLGMKKGEKKSMKEFSKGHKTIDQTIKGLNKK